MTKSRAVTASKKKKIAVCFGGPSPEHDVSIVTGLQVMDAIDRDRYEPIPAYLAWDRRFFTGPGLGLRGSYRPHPLAMPGAQSCHFYNLPNYGPALLRDADGLDQRDPILIHAAVLAFHGLEGEDGRVQSRMEMAGVPFTGMRSTMTALAMRKDLTKDLIERAGVPVLPHVVLAKPQRGRILPLETLKQQVSSNLFPAIVKPCSLGSSIGVALVADHQELLEVLPSIFAQDPLVMVEPAVQNLAEYNVSILNRGGEILTSAIERPKQSGELLDFKEKYLAGGGGKKGGGVKTPGDSGSGGMLSMTRDINPELSAELEAQIRGHAKTVYRLFGQTGVPRFDYLYDQVSGELFFNEINPIPGSFAFFLWERAATPYTFPDLLNHMIDEAVVQHRWSNLDPVPKDAYLLPR